MKMGREVGMFEKRKVGKKRSTQILAFLVLILFRSFNEFVVKVYGSCARYYIDANN